MDKEQGTKNRPIIIIGVVAALATMCATCSAAPLGNILPLGDSITYGAPIPGGYRTRLCHDLANAGYSFTFIGTLTDNPSGTLTASGQTHHEGHRSYTIQNIDDNLNTYLSSSSDPDYILLMIGTNDFLGSASQSSRRSAIDRLDALIGHITNVRPTAHLIVANLTPRTDGDFESEIQTMFNPLVPGLVGKHAALGERVSFVDMHRVLLPSDLVDNAHPNGPGYDKMGDAWFQAIQAVSEPSSLTHLVGADVTAASCRWRHVPSFGGRTITQLLGGRRHLRHRS
jgi:lysophospholipase L1-like esterase